MLLGLAPTVTDAVGVCDTERERLCVELGVCDGVPLVDAVGVPVDVPVGVGSAVAVVDAVAVGVTVAESDTEGVPLAVPPVERVVVGDVVIVDE